MQLQRELNLSPLCFLNCLPDVALRLLQGVFCIGLRHFGFQHHECGRNVVASFFQRFAR
jgi:hypothetical protein